MGSKMQDLETPTLFKAFFKIRQTSSDYCCVCLRTGSERRLVKPKTFKKFIAAISLDCDLDTNSLVCYMCERQSNNAYKFFKAAVFATTVKQLLKEYLEKRNTGASELFERRRFKHLLATKRRDCERPFEEWEVQLQEIRTRTQLLRTEVLVVDSIGPQISPPDNSTFTNDGLSDVYIVPDEPHELMNKLHTSNQPPTTDAVISLDEDDEIVPINEPTPKPGPKLRPIQHLLDPPRIHSKEIVYDSFSEPASEPSPLAPSCNRPPTTSTDTLITAPSVNQIPIPTDKLAPSGMVSVNDNFFLHPIVIDKYGNLTVPSLTSHIVKNMVTLPQISYSQLQTKDVDTNQRYTINNNTFQIGQSANISSAIQLPQQNVVNSIEPNKPFCIQVSNNGAIQTRKNSDSEPQNKQANDTTDHLKRINDLANEIKSQAEHDTGNRSNDVMALKQKAGAKSKRSSDVITPLITDVHSTNGNEKKKKKKDEKGDRIDWEDKIPMDVISFMDAIDPNADEILNGTPTPTPQSPRSPQSPQYAITEVRSLRTDTTSKHKEFNNVIDLC